MVKMGIRKVILGLLIATSGWGQPLPVTTSNGTGGSETVYQDFFARAHMEVMLGNQANNLLEMTPNGFSYIKYPTAAAVDNTYIANPQNLLFVSPPSSGTVSEFFPNNEITPKMQVNFQRTALTSGIDKAIADLERQAQEMTQGCAAGATLGQQIGLEEDINYTPIEQDMFDFENAVCLHPSGTDANGNTCGYKLKGFTYTDLANLCKARNAIIDGTETDPPELKSCHVSNCTIASYLGIIELLKTRDNYEDIKEDLKCRLSESGKFKGWGPIYSEYIKYSGLEHLTDYLVENYELDAQYELLQKDQLKTYADQGIPAKGNPLQLNRSGGSGHAVIFSNYRRNEAGEVTHICYWSSNYSANGTGIVTSPSDEIPQEGEGGNRCESLTKSDKPKYNIKTIAAAQGFEEQKSY